MNRHNLMAASAVATMICLALAPLVAGGASDPVASGSYTTIRWASYHDDENVKMMAHVTKLTSENDNTYDYYNIANYLKQKKSSARYDQAHLATYMGQSHSTEPDELDWAPGFASVGGNDVTYSVQAGTGGVNVGMSWTQNWKGSWTIEQQSDADSVDGSIQYEVHQDFFNAPHSETGHDWNTLAQGNAWQVRQGAPVHVFVHSFIKSCDGLECSSLWPWHNSELQHFHSWDADCEGVTQADASADDQTCIDTIAINMPPTLKTTPPVDATVFDTD